MELTKESFMKTTLGSETVLFHVNPLSTNPTKWSNTLKQFVGKLPTNCLSVFDHFVKLALKELKAGFVLRYLHFDPDFLVMLNVGLMRQL